AIKAMETFHHQLKSVHPDWNDVKIHAHTGMILMNGHTDQKSELYTQDTFRRLVSYANQKGLARVSFWSLNRDRPCHQQPKEWDSDLCSSISQKPYEFSHIIAGFNH